MEYTGQSGRLSWLAAAALGVQTFHEDSSPFYPTDPGKQNAMQAAFGNSVIYPARNVTGPSFNVNGQLEYQLDNGLSIGGLAGVNNASEFHRRHRQGVSTQEALACCPPPPSCQDRFPGACDGGRLG